MDSVLKKSRRNLRSLSCSLLLIAAMVAAPVVATAAPVALQHDGRNGVWFPRDEADKLLWKIQVEIPNLQDTIVLQDQVIKTQLQLIATSSRAQTATERYAERERELRVHFQNAYIDEVKRQDSIWNSSTFWLVVGAAVGGSVSAAIVFAAK